MAKLKYEEDLISYLILQGELMLFLYGVVSEKCLFLKKKTCKNLTENLTNFRRNHLYNAFTDEYLELYDFFFLQRKLETVKITFLKKKMRSYRFLDKIHQTIEYTANT
jgi:hypothetical protein